jgi:integrase
VTKRRQYGNIRKLASGRWQARYWRLGKQVCAPRTFATKADANAWLAGIETDTLRGDLVPTQDAKTTFGEYSEKWLDLRANLRPHTRGTYESQLWHVLQMFEDIPLARIDSTHIREWHADLLRGDLHANTVAKIYRLTRTIFDTAVTDGLIRLNPCRIKGAAVVERPIVTWTEVRRLSEVIEPRFAAFVWIAAMSGLRFGELTGLQRGDVDLDTGSIRVERALTFVTGDGAVFGPPKSAAAYRSVVLPKDGVRVLRRHIEEYAHSSPSSLVFTSVKGSPLLNRYFHPYWTQAKAAAGVDAHVRFHDLRHLAGTTAASAGASIKEVMARMGHSSPDAAIRYLKASEQRDKEVAGRIQRRVDFELRDDR